MAETSAKHDDWSAKHPAGAGQAAAEKRQTAEKQMRTAIVEKRLSAKALVSHGEFGPTRIGGPSA